MTVNAKNVRKTLAVLGIFTAAAFLFCMWALLAHGNQAVQGGQAASESDSSVPLMTIVSLSDAPSVLRASTDVSDEQQPEEALPAYINLSPFSLSHQVHLPLDSAFVTSPFGFRDHPINGKYAFHSGMDLASAEGSPIYAMLDGKVSKAEYDSGYGNFVVIDHGEDVQTLYAHCLSLSVQEGDTVSRGDTIALVGQTGSATGPHLHVELRYGGQRFDPTYILGDSYS